MEQRENPALQTRAAAHPHPIAQIPKYPIKVVYVYKHPHNSNDETLTTIRDWCQYLKIDFNAREYDSSKFREDRDEIERLPALHLYEKSLREETFYPDRRPLQVIEDSYRKFQRLEKEEKEKKEAWQRWKDKWKERFLSIGKRETRMERYEREQQTYQETMRRSASDQIMIKVEEPTTPPITQARGSRKQILSSRF